ncbi:glycosyl transferase, family 2 [mine drainage metagenome]|uniref:Glycosyl transferase, family 2 n=1 Tax=mine drainage metagenome TaxID=410659 RepID=T0YST9_9ZZZZ
MTKAFISVVIPAFDRREFLRDAVASVFGQTLPRSDFELVVIKNFDEPDVDALRGTPGMKILWDDSPALGAMLLKAIEASEGEIVCFLDDDDLFEPDKLDRIARLFREDPTRTFVHDSILAVDRLGNPIPGWDRIRPQPTISYSVASAVDRRAKTPEFFRCGSNVNLSAMSVRNSLLRKVADRLRRVHTSPDIFVFFASLASEGSLWIERERLTRYRFHSSWSHAQVEEGRWAFEAQRLIQEVETADLIREMTRGTPAEIPALGYVAEARFQYYMMVPEAPPPRWGQYIELVRAAWARRQPYLVDRLLWALAKRVAPQSTTRRYHRRSHARHSQLLAP